jgi:hypothetical protein
MAKHRTGNPFQLPVKRLSSFQFPCHWRPGNPIIFVSFCTGYVQRFTLFDGPFCCDDRHRLWFTPTSRFPLEKFTIRVISLGESYDKDDVSEIPLPFFASVTMTGSSKVIKGNDNDKRPKVKHTRE